MKRAPRVAVSPGMASSEPFRIALVIDHIESDYHAEIIAGALRAARSSPVRILIVAGGWLGTPSEPVARNFVHDLLCKARLDGLLFLGGSLSNHSGVAHFREWIRRFESIPSVVIGVDVPGLAHVRVDNGVGVHALVSHLIERHNRRRIAFIRGPAESGEAEARRLAYLQALHDHGIPSDDRLIVSGGLDRKYGAIGVSQLFDERHFTTSTLNAIVAVNDDVGLGALEELTRRAILVPEPVSLVGFDDAESARIANPPMTTVNQRVEVQGYTAMRGLIDALEGGRPPSSMILQPNVVIRVSCGCGRQVQNQVSATSPLQPKLARSCRLALIERRSIVIAELARAAAGRIVGTGGWESKLLDALDRNLGTPDATGFGEEVERLVRRQLSLGHDAIAYHDVLTALRSQVLVCASVEPDIRPRIEDIFHESRLTVARSAADVERDRQRTMTLRMRTITKSCLSLFGTGKPGDLAAALEEHLPLMGISTFIVSRFRDGRPLDELDVFAQHSSLMHAGRSAVLSASELGLDAIFEQQGAIVVEPLEYDGEPMGIASFTWGAHDPVHYEQLRELLSAALRAIRPSLSGSTSP